jgi:ABC-type polysaccharide/polyol phosphate transport system ATPase subunit
MSENLIDAKNLSLSVPYYQPEARKLMTMPRRLLSDVYFRRARRSGRTILKNLTFSLAPGERIGIIGSNGAGKSSLLRVLGGVYPVTDGELTVRGEARGLFNIQLGMNLEGTGIENIYLRGLQMGLNLTEIRERVESVVEFSGLGDDINAPIGIYSTGMMLRLAFAVSTMIEPDILLLDEWIGSGDVSFRDKTEERMNSLVDKSRGLVLATHNAMLMKRLCSRGIVLDNGSAVFDGEIEAALEHYMGMLSSGAAISK